MGEPSLITVAWMPRFCWLIAFATSWRVELASISILVSYEPSIFAGVAESADPSILRSLAIDPELTSWMRSVPVPGVVSSTRRPSPVSLIRNRTPLSAAMAAPLPSLITSPRTTSSGWPRSTVNCTPLVSVTWNFPACTPVPPFNVESRVRPLRNWTSTSEPSIVFSVADTTSPRSAAAEPVASAALSVPVPPEKSVNRNPLETGLYPILIFTPAAARPPFTRRMMSRTPSLLETTAFPRTTFPESALSNVIVEPLIPMIVCSSAPADVWMRKRFPTANPAVEATSKEADVPEAVTVV